MTGAGAITTLLARTTTAAVAIIAVGGATASPALAGWRATPAVRASLLYNQGITFDQARGEFFFDGLTSGTNSGLFRTNAQLVQTGANKTVLPATKEGYNHIGDLSFDAVRRRVLLPMECDYPAKGGNTCGVGAIGVANPSTLRLQFYVNLDTRQIKKAMWDEISPDGRWIWTSSETHLLAYSAAAVNSTTAARQRSGAAGGIVGTDLGAVLPTGSVTGAAFYEDALTRGLRLELALNRGTYDEVVSYAVAGDGSPRLLSTTPRSETKVQRSALTNESEGLAVTGPVNGRLPLDGVLHWQELPVFTGTTLYSRILNYLPQPPPPRDSASVQAGQRLRPALSKGLRLTLVCNSRCTGTASATIAGKLARRVGLLPANAKAKTYLVATGSLAAGTGGRTLTIIFGSRAKAALHDLRSVRLSITVHATYVYSRHRLTYRLATTLRQPAGRG